MYQFRCETVNVDCLRNDEPKVLRCL
jgi:hypothetical protein